MFTVHHKVAAVILIFCGICQGQILDLTEECRRDWDHVQDSILQEWASDLWDSRGVWEAGFNSGNNVFEGDYGQCINSKENASVPNPVQGMYCLATWWFPEIFDPLYTRGLGYCIPDTCTDTDARVLLKSVFYVHVFQPQTGTIQINCQRGRDLSNDAGAIVSIVILLLIAVVVLIATTYDYLVVNGVRCASESSDFGQVSPTDSIAGLDNKGVKLSAASLKQMETASNVQMNFEAPENTNNNNRNAETSGDRTDVTPDNNVDTVIELSEKTMQRTAVGDKHAEFSPQTKQEPVNRKKENPHTSIPARLLVSFSLYTNVPRLVSAKQPPGSFKCLHGIRFLTMCWIMLGHTYQLGTYLTTAPTVSNRWAMLEELGKYYYQVINSMWLAVESFFVMSALLTTISFMKSIKRQGDKVTAKQMLLYYVHRYWRLTPVYMIVLMIFTNLYYYMGEGAFFKERNPEVESCKDTWWQHLLYIQNLFPPEDYSSCMGWTWYLANDFQFYVMAPAFLILVYFYPIVGLPLMFAGYSGSMIANGVLYGKEASETLPSAHFTDIYIRPWTRVSSYFIGMALGCIIYKTLKKKPKIHPILVVIGWVCAMTIIWNCVFVFWTPGPTFKTFQTTLFALGVSWIIFACLSGYGGIINVILSWNFWVPLSRLTYTGYLLHPIFIYLFMYTRPVQLYFYNRLLIYLFSGHLLITLCASFVLTLMFEIPMMGLEKVILPSNRK